MVKIILEKAEVENNLKQFQVDLKKVFLYVLPKILVPD